MEPVSLELDTAQQASADPLPFVRNYQLEALENALKQNTIVFLETGSGKTLIAIMLMRSYAYLLRKPSPFIAVFLAPKVGLVSQVLVMTPRILLDGLRHNFFNQNMIKVLVLDECHHVCGKHPYASIMTVNIIVATSILEEGLDVQRCNLVIRFDPSPTLCSFIQSRGRARMQNSDYLLMVKSGDFITQSRNGHTMRKEVLRPVSLPCFPLNNQMYDEDFYHAESTGAIVILSLSVGLIRFYCSRLLSDGYFRPTPRFDINKEMGICTLYLPNSCCPVRTVTAWENIKTLKQTACLEACKKLHRIGALTDNLVPDIVVEETDLQKLGNEPYNSEHPIYFPSELVNQCPHHTKTMYHCYLIELKQNFNYDIPTHDIVLAMRTELDSEIRKVNFDLKVDRGRLTARLKYFGHIELSLVQVLCRRFQITLFRFLIDHNVDKLDEILDGFQLQNNLEMDYLLLPSSGQLVNWKSVTSLLFPCDNVLKHDMNCSMTCNDRVVQTKSGSLCTCLIRNSLVSTPHNGHMYYIMGVLDHLNANSLFMRNDGSAITCKKHYEEQHGIQSCFDRELLLNGRCIFHVQNYLSKCRQQKQKEPSKISFELPPELCRIILFPISLSTFYSFSFVPSIMHRLQSPLLAVNLKKMLLDHCMQNVVIPTVKVLEAITQRSAKRVFI